MENRYSRLLAASDALEDARHHVDDAAMYVRDAGFPMSGAELERAGEAMRSLQFDIEDAMDEEVAREV